MNYEVSKWYLIPILEDESWDTSILRCFMHWVMNYEFCNHTTIRPFKGRRVNAQRVCDRLYCGNLTSLITWGTMS